MHLAETRKVHIETWGCQMNVADSETMFAQLKAQNYEHTDDASAADLVILNTCHIREKAYHKVVSRLGVLKDLKQSRPNMKIAVAGCVAQAEGKRLFEEERGIDILIGPGQIPELTGLIADHDQTKQPVKALGFSKKAPSHALPTETPVESFLKGRTTVTRYVNIQQGCNNFCTFCVVPFTRGGEISDRPDEIVEKVKAHVAGGAYEITLLGQNVNSYGLDLVKQGTLPASPDGPFVDLLRRVAEVPGLLRLRFTTSNPHDFTKSLANLFATHPILGRYCHLPVQSGSDAMLTAMKRKVTVDEYRERVRWLRESIPDMALSTDLIVGFPGETDDDFAATVALVEEVQYSFAFCFAYSKRKGTAAQRFRDQIPEEEKVKRLNHLIQVQDRITTALNAAEEGQVRSVLFHYESKKQAGMMYGRTEQFRLVRVKAGRDLLGRELGVRITGGNKTALEGVLI